MFKFITIEGNIGAGKTSLSQMLSEKFGAEVLLEKYIDNPFLPLFYGDRRRYAFSVETAFLSERFHQFHNEFEIYRKKGADIISDYSLYKSLIFSKSNLDEQEFRLFQDLFQIVNQQLPQPGLFVYLHNDIQELMKNIAKRGRDFERKITPEYLLRIENGYFNFMENASGLKCLVLDMKNMDFVNNPDDFQLIYDTLISDYRYGITKITLKP